MRAPNEEWLCLAFHRAFDSAPEAMVICSLPTLEILYLNASAKRLLGEHTLTLADRLDPAPEWLDEASTKIGWLTTPGQTPVAVEVRAERIAESELVGTVRLQPLAENWLARQLSDTMALVNVRDHLGRLLFATPRGAAIGADAVGEIRLGELWYHLERHVAPSRSLTVGVDVSLHKKASDLEQQRAELFHLLLNSTEDFIGLVDDRENRLYVSPSFYRATGYSAEEIASTNFRTRVHPDDLYLVERARQANLRGERTRIEYRCRCKNGTYVWLDLRATPIPDESGRISRIVWSSRDVSDRKRVEQELRDSRRFIERIADTLPHMLFIYDVVENRHVWVNARCEEIRGYSQGELLRMGPGEAVSQIHPDDRLEMNQSMQMLTKLGENEVLDLRYRILHRVMGYRLVRTRCMVFRYDNEGKPRQVLGVSELIDERRDYSISVE